MLTVSRRSRPTFDDVFDFNRALSRMWGDSNYQPATELIGSYPVDIREDDAHLYVDAEMPGFTKDQISVTLENGVLTIEAQRKTDDGKDTGKTERHLTERRFTRVARSFSLPTMVDENKVDAHLANGVLHLTLNKREEVKPRKIEVK